MRDGERRRLGWPGLVSLLILYLLVPQTVSLFAFGVEAIDEGFTTLSGILASDLVPDVGGALIALGVIAWLGWTREVMVDDRPVRRWVWVVPAVLVVASIAAVDYGRLADLGPTLVVTLLLSNLSTGLSEELVFRGVALQMLRDRHSELTAGVVSSVLFGAMHLINALVLGSAAVPQAILATGMGWLLYLTRRVSGGILLPIVVHALYDFSTFSSVVGTAPEEPISDAATALILLQLALLVAVVAAHRATAPRPGDPVR